MQYAAISHERFRTKMDAAWRRGGPQGGPSLADASGYDGECGGSVYDGATPRSRFGLRWSPLSPFSPLLSVQPPPGSVHCAFGLDSSSALSTHTAKNGCSWPRFRMKSRNGRLNMRNIRVDFA